jgi:hypothetical protein
MFCITFDRYHLNQARSRPGFEHYQYYQAQARARADLYWMECEYPVAGCVEPSGSSTRVWLLLEWYRQLLPWEQDSRSVNLTARLHLVRRLGCLELYLLFPPNHHEVLMKYRTTLSFFNL